MAFVEIELKEKLEHAKMTTFFRAFSYLLIAGYPDLEAFSNALYFYPDYDWKGFSRVVVIEDLDKNQYRFQLYEFPKDDKLAHLNEYIRYCQENYFDSGLCLICIDFTITLEALYNFLRDNLEKNNEHNFYQKTIDIGDRDRGDDLFGCDAEDVEEDIDEEIEEDIVA